MTEKPSTNIVIASDGDYTVIYWKEDDSYVGLYRHEPFLSWMADTPDGALEGIKRLVADFDEAGKAP